MVCQHLVPGNMLYVFIYGFFYMLAKCSDIINCLLIFIEDG